jgi:flagellar biosynthesis anti-sigma factor FlgM
MVSGEHFKGRVVCKEAEMNVNFQTALHNTRVAYRDKVNTASRYEKAYTTVSAPTASYDRVSLRTKEEPEMDDHTFAGALARKTAESMPNGVSDARVAELKAKVQSGTYNIDSTRIAAKMLGYRG